MPGAAAVGAALDGGVVHAGVEDELLLARDLPGADRGGFGAQPPEFCAVRGRLALSKGNVRPRPGLCAGFALSEGRR